LTDRNEELKEAIVLAIYAEIGAMNFYSELAGRIDNPEGKEKFEQLSRDEAGHRDTLKSWFSRKFSVEFEERADKIAGSEIGKLPIGEHAGAMEALSMAIDAEEKAREFYLGEAEKAVDGELKDMFNKLAKQEQGHYDLLTAEKNALAGGFYWFDMDAGGFLED
jgi:rubrerythrin